MADEQFDPQVKSKKGGMSAKIFLLGIPLFIIQLVGVYFIVAYLLQQKYGYPTDPTSVEHQTEQLNTDHSAELDDDETITDTSSLGNFIYSVEDLMLNPAGGTVIMLVSVGFDVQSELMKTTMEEKEVLVRDRIITTLSQKTLNELSIQNRDSLKIELANNIEHLFNNVKINTIYFSKYIIQ